MKHLIFLIFKIFLLVFYFFEKLGLHINFTKYSLLTTIFLK